MSEYYKNEIDRHFAWFEGKLPSKPARFVGWLRKPSSRYARMPIGTLLIFGGVFSFLPVSDSGCCRSDSFCSRRTCRCCKNRPHERSDGLSASGSSASVPRTRNRSGQRVQETLFPVVLRCMM